MPIFRCLAPLIHSTICMRALSLYATPFMLSKGRLIRCTVPGSTPNRFAILRTPSVRLGAFKAARASSSGAMRGRPSCFPSSLARLSPARTRSGRRPIDILRAILYHFLREAVRIVDKPVLEKRKRIEAIGYMGTSSGTNVGEGKDSELRQRKAIEGYAKSAGMVIVDWFYDKAVRGSDAVMDRPGFVAMLERIVSNGVRTIIVESPDRFARDLAVQLTGHDHLRKLGVTLIPATAPDFFTEDTPTAVLVRQVLGAIAQFEKNTTILKLKAARDRKLAAGEKCGGRKSYAERDPDLIKLARQLYRPDPNLRPVSLRKVAAALAAQGKVTPNGLPYSASAVASMLAQ